VKTVLTALPPAKKTRCKAQGVENGLPVLVESSGMVAAWAIFDAWVDWALGTEECDCDNARLDRFGNEAAHDQWHAFQAGALAQQAQSLPEHVKEHMIEVCERCKIDAQQAPLTDDALILELRELAHPERHYAVTRYKAAMILAASRLMAQPVNLGGKAQPRESAGAWASGTNNALAERMTKLADRFAALRSAYHEHTVGTPFRNDIVQAMRDAADALRAKYKEEKP
jgi:hypothetical protein